MGVIVIACFKPKEGKQEMLLEVIKEHLPVLRKEDLISERQGYAMKTADGSVIEVFEWKSEKAIEDAHKNAAVLELWKKFEEACDYIPLNSIEESKNFFPGFIPLENQQGTI